MFFSEQNNDNYQNKLRHVISADNIFDDAVYTGVPLYVYECIIIDDAVHTGVALYVWV